MLFWTNQNTVALYGIINVFQVISDELSIFAINEVWVLYNEDSMKIAIHDWRYWWINISWMEMIFRFHIT